MTKTKLKMLSLGLEPRQAEELKKLSERTRIPQQAFLREAVADLLKKYRRKG
jgi:hypothetical protein